MKGGDILLNMFKKDKSVGGLTDISKDKDIKLYGASETKHIKH